MKPRILLVGAALAALVLAPGALAHGKPDDAGGKAEKQAVKLEKQAAKAACGPRVAVVVKGTISAIDLTASSVTLAVVEANDHGTRFEGTALTVTLGEGTKIRRDGPAAITDLVVGDGAKLMAKACKKQLADTAATPVLVAKHLKAKPATTAKPEDAKPAEQPAA